MTELNPEYEKANSWLKLQEIAIPRITHSSEKGIIYYVLRLGFDSVANSVCTELGIGDSPAEGRAILPTVSIQFGEGIYDYRLPLHYSGWVYQTLDMSLVEFPANIEFYEKNGNFHADTIVV
ncbi:MAG: hypothetical protein IH840_12335 [Candidatus Heimdallarchaeota archaeon]|nr:hypothetical protein [Candidatus Heimdallarchaeota archaeon]